MSKRELYDALLAAGVKLPEYRRITQAELEKAYDALVVTEAENTAQADKAAEKVPEERQGVPPALFFATAGWCEELKRSYFMGYYWPQSWAEYDALRPYAKGGAE